MKANFIKNVICCGSVDTKKYRYIAKEFDDRLEIQRIPLNMLDTTDAIDSWETLEVIR